MKWISSHSRWIKQSRKGAEDSLTTCADKYEASSPEKHNSIPVTTTFPEEMQTKLNTCFSFVNWERRLRSESHDNKQPTPCRSCWLPEVLTKPSFSFCVRLCYALFFVLFQLWEHLLLIWFDSLLLCWAYRTGSLPPSVLCVVAVSDQAHFLLIAFADTIMLERNYRNFNKNNKNGPR